MTWSPPFEAPADDDIGRVPPWMISFADLVSLLLSFTILVFAYAQLEGEKWSEAARSIRATFGGPPWMTPDRAVQPSVELTPALPTLDLGYLAQVIEARLGGGPEGVRTRLDGGRLRIVPPSAEIVPGEQDGNRRRSPLIRLGAIFARAGNAMIIDVRVPNGSDVGGAPAEAEWRIALAEATGVAASFKEAGVAPNRIAVMAAAGDATASPGQPVIEVIVLNHGGRP